MLLLLNNPLAFSQKHQELSLATTAWCPYTCNFEPFEFGIIGHYITQVLAKHNINVHIQSYPWSRAINLANSGAVDGLLTAIKSEAPNLLLTDTPITDYQVCFFTRNNQDWRYKIPLDFTGMRLGVIQDYGYGEPLDSYILKSSAESLVIKISGDLGTKRLVDMLLNDRIDIFVEDKKVVAWQLAQHNTSQSFLRNAGCLPKQPFYLALYPNDKNRRLIDLLNQLLEDEENQQTLQSLFQ
ncbi:transporter substrate-binding domain-containing protein [Thalassotalea sp. M1531]|uniref:Transporter substrate-binding domain-containing protein n=1 Tax=Thalassotalea algicola TaxID=2716224 RepID=A0A7Y0LAU1_9GAMM|nr:transporter substrate-binding domain-containing protein [Thalassotalea algicola]NMP30702.1 transporter substrate-binding domain-containing protein [Thalassotalea algicola]